MKTNKVVLSDHQADELGLGKSLSKQIALGLRAYKRKVAVTRGCNRRAFQIEGTTETKGQDGQD